MNPEGFLRSVASNQLNVYDIYSIEYEWLALLVFYTSAGQNAK